MNGKTAKALRRMAREEMSMDKGVVERDIVAFSDANQTTALNAPNTNRALYLRLKQAVRNTRSQR